MKETTALQSEDAVSTSRIEREIGGDLQEREERRLVDDGSGRHCNRL